MTVLGEWETLELAEITIVAVGAVLLILQAGILSRHRRWGAVLSLSEPPAHRLEPADLLLALMALLFVPMVLHEAVALWQGEPAAPASQPDQRAPSQALTVSVAVGQLCIGVILLWIGKNRFAGGMAGWGLNGRRLGARAWQAVVAYVAVWPVCYGTLFLTRALIQWAAPDYVFSEHEAIRTLRSEDVSGWMSALTALSALVFAPVVEELFFRGLLLPALMRWWRSGWAAILFSGCFFGLFHAANADTIPALTVFGVVLAYAYARTGSLTLVILFHAMFNAKTLLWIALSP